ncbi:Uncharacterised protein [Mycobacterium tuberculosis]|uniref:Uncharacterized protein n=1 Tax=Mycobacterium tuberculosis TaxID=1773 RepID=A0A916PCF7_MYCTX|nr:Uncharacterised protein [Mycobacterium tuberculosis]COY91502.1 Uncharacterised protein [Mycobacterium tuberculosis]
MVKSGDVDRCGAGDSLARRDDELAVHRAADHRAHLLQVQIRDVFAERVELADQCP